MTPKTTLAVLLLAGLAAPALAAPAKQLPPNILLVVTDDLSAHLGPYGYRDVETPNLDKLAARGVRFEHAYSPYPICNPSRVSLLSGLSPETTQVYNNLIPPRVHLPNLVFLPSYLHDHGYHTFRAGKVVHSTFDDAAPFDEVAELNDVSFDAPFPKIRHPEPPPAAVAEREKLRQEGKKVPTNPLGVDRLFGQALPDREAVWLEDSRVAELAVRFLRRAASLPASPGGRTGPEVRTSGAPARTGALAGKGAPPAKPFFAAIGLGGSHPPWTVPERWARHYTPAKLPIAFALADDRADVPPIAFKFATLRPGFSTEKQHELRAAYFAAVSFQDEQVGRILDTLAETGLDRDTIVVFVSDHGQHLGEHGGLWEKMTLFEEATRVPFFLAGPGVPRGRVEPCVVELLDVFPTLLALAGQPIPAGLDGRSLKPLLETPGTCDDRGALSWIWMGGEPSQLSRSLRTARYRYTEWLTPQVAELYDHQTDPNEITNQAHQPAAKAVLDDLRRRLAQRVAGLATHARP